ncbi:MAG TPA: GntR family transcriptional regulator [Tetrasphaera sp.]|uniref:GntR family transcriptional regulator n=1 Tax=Nostocoides sp. TaxID=1917966 RepID=UPI002BCEDB0B|nr:GntR family transcriptional regulator [Tetrasphaera sp.]HNQ06446.1 GntR family transcriptional regulator [Tetrasphaera sp.]
MKPIAVSIDRTSPVPLYHQLAEQLTAAIASGQLGPGDAFENELALADRLALSRPTVRRAIAELVARGLLVRRRGVGTTVASQVIHRRDELTSLYDDMVRRGQQPTTRVLGFRSAAKNPGAAAALGLPPETPLVSIERLRLAGDVPTAVMHNWLPPRFADISAEEVASGSLYAALRDRGVRPVIAHQTIGARRPTAAERKLLGLKPGDPLLTMTRRAYDADGAAVEFGDHCYRYDQYAFDVTVHDH